MSYVWYVCVSDESGVSIQARLDSLEALEQRVKQDNLASLDSKACQAQQEMLDCQEILEHKAGMDSQDCRGQLVNLETQVSLVILDGLAHQDQKDRLASLAHKVVKSCNFDKPAL